LARLWGVFLEDEAADFLEGADAFGGPIQMRLERWFRKLIVEKAAVLRDWREVI